MSEETECSERIARLERELTDSREREESLKRVNEALIGARKNVRSNQSSLSPPKHGSPEPAQNGLSRTQYLERRVHDLELDLRHFQVQSEREKMELREVVQQLQGDKSMLSFTISRLEDELKSRPSPPYPPLSPEARPSDVSDCGSEAVGGGSWGKECERLRGEVASLEGVVRRLKERLEAGEGQKVRKENEALREELNGWRQGKVGRYVKELEKERDTMQLQLSSLENSYRSLERAFEESHDLSQTAKLLSQDPSGHLERTATFNPGTSREFEDTQGRIGGGQKLSQRTAISSHSGEKALRREENRREESSRRDECGVNRLRIELERMKLAVDRATVERDRAMLELKEARLAWEREKSQGEDKMMTLEHHVKYLIGKLLKAKGKHEVQANETMRSWTSTHSVLLQSRPARRAASPLNVSEISRAESPYSVSEVEMC